MSITSLLKANANPLLLPKPPRQKFHSGLCCSKSVKFTANSSFSSVKVKSIIDSVSISSSKRVHATPFNFEEHSKGNNHTIELIAWLKAPVLVIVQSLLLSMMMMTTTMYGRNSALACPAVREFVSGQLKPETEIETEKDYAEQYDGDLILLFSIAICLVTASAIGISSGVIYLQVGLRVDGTFFEPKLNWFAETMDASTSDSSIEILQRTIHAVLYEPSSWEGGFSYMKECNNTEDARKHFEQLSIEALGKFDEEYFNLNNLKAEITPSQEVDIWDKKYMVVTFLVLARGKGLYNILRTINEKTDITEALEELKSISESCEIEAAKVLWTPHLKNDIRSTRQLNAEYPLLSIVKNRLVFW